MSLHVCMAGLETKTNLYINAGFKGRIGIVVGAKMYPSTLNCTLPGLFGERHFHTHTGRKSEHCRSLFDDCCCTPFFLTNKYFENIFAVQIYFFSSNECGTEFQYIKNGSLTIFFLPGINYKTCLPSLFVMEVLAQGRIHPFLSQFCRFSGDDTDVKLKLGYQSWRD